MTFFTREEEGESSISLNINHGIKDSESFKAFPWPVPDSYDYSRLEKTKKNLPNGMKLIVHGPGGVLENVISLVGFESLCMILIDNPKLAKDIFDAVGERLVRYYEIAASYDTVGALIANDDWGFKTQTMLSPIELRKYVFPWHKKIVEAIHVAGKLSMGALKPANNVRFKTSQKGAYALGGGNRIPEYVPNDKFFAMIGCVKEGAL